MSKRFDVDLLLLILVGLSGIAISMLDFFGIMERSPLLSGRIPSMSLLVIGVIAVYLAFERRAKLDRLEEIIMGGFETTILSLDGGPIRVFKDSEALYDYLAKRISEAQSSVDDLTWGEISSTVKTKKQDIAFDQYLSAIRTTLIRGAIRYREVMTFPSDGILREQRLYRAKTMMEGGFFNYELGYYRLNHENAPPLVQFFVIDAKEAIVAFYRGKDLPVEGTVHFSTLNPQIVKFFQDYYNAIWGGAIKLKPAGGTPNLEELQRIQNSEF